VNSTIAAPVKLAGAHSSARMATSPIVAPLLTQAIMPNIQNEPETDARQKRTKYEDKPPSIKGVEWSKNRSGGWDCRTFRELPDGTVTDRQYIGYLGKRKLKEWRAQYKGEALRQVIAAWIAEKQAEK
jgi:hypothetical protein